MRGHWCCIERHHCRAYDRCLHMSKFARDELRDPPALCAILKLPERQHSWELYLIGLPQHTPSRISLKIRRSLLGMPITYGSWSIACRAASVEPRQIPLCPMARLEGSPVTAFFGFIVIFWPSGLVSCLSLHHDACCPNLQTAGCHRLHVLPDHLAQSRASRRQSHTPRLRFGSVDEQAHSNLTALSADARLAR